MALQIKCIYSGGQNDQDVLAEVSITMTTVTVGVGVDDNLKININDSRF